MKSENHGNLLKKNNSLWRKLAVFANYKNVIKGLNSWNNVVTSAINHAYCFIITKLFVNCNKSGDGIKDMIGEEVG